MIITAHLHPVLQEVGEKLIMYFVWPKGIPPFYDLSTYTFFAVHVRSSFQSKL